MHEWFKSAAIRGLKESGTAFIEEVANELTTDELTRLIAVLSKVKDGRTKHVTINVKVG